MPAATKSGAGISQASRLSLKPCRASTMTRGLASVCQTRTGNFAPSDMMNESLAHSGEAVRRPGGALLATQPESRAPEPSNIERRVIEMAERDVFESMLRLAIHALDYLRSQNLKEKRCR